MVFSLDGKTTKVSFSERKKNKKTKSNCQWQKMILRQKFKKKKLK